MSPMSDQPLTRAVLTQALVEFHRDVILPDIQKVVEASEGRWLVRADDHTTLCDALASVPRPPGRLRIEVDPLRV